MGIWIDYKELRSKLPFANVLQHYRVDTKMKGDRALAFCPLPAHPTRDDDRPRTASLSIHLTRNIFQCFGCKASGNALEFACLMEGFDPAVPDQFRSGAIKVAETFGIDAARRNDSKSAAARNQPRNVEVPEKRSLTGSASSPSTMPSRINDPLDFQLRDLDPDHPYLQERGFLRETVEHFGLGYCNRGMLKGRIANPAPVGRYVQNPPFHYPSDPCHHTAPNSGQGRHMPDAKKRRTVSPKRPDPPDWNQILSDAVNKPGVISTAYRAFWNYSVGNQLLAFFECAARGLEVGPINTFRKWLALKRYVRKGERAITLCMPVTWKETPDPRQHPDTGEAAATTTVAVTRRRFIYRPNWFVLSQTDGETYVPLAIPQWDEQLACEILTIDRVPFTHFNGNVQGFAHKRHFAVSPVAHLPHRTTFHEIAHIVLGHCAEAGDMTDSSERTPRDVREVEAESVSLICCQSLGLPGDQFSRGYLQHWLRQEKIEERSVHRIFTAADQILKAGRPGAQHEIDSELSA